MSKKHKPRLRVGELYKWHLPPNSLYRLNAVGLSMVLVSPWPLDRVTVEWGDREYAIPLEEFTKLYKPTNNLAE